MYRAVKELINNAAKHGPARQIVVHLRGREGVLRVIVDDDGRGFSPSPMVRDARSQTGLGLAWIRERLHALGGKLLLESVPGGGARVILDVPDVATTATSGKEAL